MPPASLVNILALGLVGVVTAGLYMLFSNSTNDHHQQTSYQTSQRPRRQQPRHSSSREKNSCFCQEESKPTNCSLINCGHFFHKECLQKWAEERTQPSCPFCREDFRIGLDVRNL